MLLLIAAAFAQADPATATATPDPFIARMASLYDELCLQAFPIDDTLDALMAKKGARALTPEQVKVTLRDDPGRGWELMDSGKTVLVFLELPPYHACSVRFAIPAASLSDLSAYRTIAAAYEGSRRGFVPIKPLEGDMGDIHIHAVGEQRELPGGNAEALFVFDQHVTDATRRANGETGVQLRFVHQFMVGH